MIVLIRHGEAEHNVKRLFDSSIDSKSYLTDVGVQQIIDTTNLIKNEFKKKYYKVSRIFCSPFIRTIESARLFKKIMKDNNLYKDDRFCIDYRIREIEMGKYDKCHISEYPDGSWVFDNNEKYGGESIADVNNRCVDFLKSLNPYNINIVVTHGEPFRRMVYLLSKTDIQPIRGQGVIIEDVTNTITFNTNGI